MSTPKRIQRKRTKGWKMPEGATYVGRPTRWGNPWAIKRLSSWEYVGINPDGTEAVEGWGGRDHAAHWAVYAYRAAVKRDLVWYLDVPDREALFMPLSDLVGRDLACWCPLDQPCHADVLLELANPKELA